MSDPRVVADGSMGASRRATWDCVWLGSYPQTLVTDASTVAALDAATGWSASGDLAYGGATYRRLKKADATNNPTYSDYWDQWDWGQASTAGYCYFLWEPVKWRVLEANGSTALVLSDVALDDRRYHGADTDVTWKTCDLRAWLDRTFRGDAFTFAQQDAVVPQMLANDGNIHFNTSDGSFTTDQVFLLSELDVWSTDAAARHGFYRTYCIPDETHQCKPSDYAHAMGANAYSGGPFDDNCCWWLRSFDHGVPGAAYVNAAAFFPRHVGSASDEFIAVRPALRISLSSDQVSYAGTVCSDGTVDEAAPVLV